MTILYVTTDEREARRLLSLDHETHISFSAYDSRLGEAMRKNLGLCFNPMLSINFNGTDERMVDNMARKLLKHNLWVAAHLSDGRIEHYDPRPEQPESRHYRDFHGQLRIVK